jgi:hypothetical protein
MIFHAKGWVWVETKPRKRCGSAKRSVFAFIAPRQTFGLDLTRERAYRRRAREKLLAPGPEDMT